MSSSSPLEIGSLPRELMPTALWLVFADEPETERSPRVAAVVRAAAAGRVDLSTLLGARRGERVVGALWLQIQPGRVALLWPPRLVSGEPIELASELLHRADGLLTERGVRLSQALLRPEDFESIQRLRRHGYRIAADLLYLACPLHEVHLPPPGNEEPLAFEPFRNDQEVRLREVLEATYIETLDIPALDGIRDISDVLEGYRHAGAFAPERWLFVSSNGRDVGCLLLADHPEQDQWELVYMGLVPEARGRGWGLALVQRAQRLAREAGRARLVLAVDAQNDPALAIYARAGFYECLKRTVLIKTN